MAEQSVYQACEAQLFSQIELFEQASRLRASPPNVRLRKEVLLQQLSHIRAAEAARDRSENITLYYVIPEYYPPCTVPYENLAKINIRDLRTQTHHLGKVLIVRVAGKPFASVGIMAVVEDSEGDAERVVLYHQDPILPEDAILTEGALIPIKQPYYDSVGQNRHVVRIDHVSDVVSVTPPEAELLRLPLDWKDEGNRSFARKDYLCAIKCYTLGLHRTNPSHTDLANTLRNNRAQANLAAERYEAARDDCLAILGNDLSSDRKARFRLASALYGLGKYEEARDLFNTCGTDVSKPALQRIEVRLMEQNKGKYQLGPIRKHIDPSNKQLTGYKVDAASYTRLTEVKDAGEAGRGLFATKAIYTGEIVLCEKAYGVSITPPDDKRVHCIIDVTKRRFKLASGEPLLVQTIQKMCRNPLSADKLFDLYSGDYRKVSGVGTKVDKNLVIDTFHIDNTLALNSMGTNAPGEGVGSGLWVQAAYINHSCMPNSMHTFYGDLLVLRATRNISAGEEITFAYTPLSYDVDERQGRFQQTWGFVCSCHLCSLELGSTSRVYRHRLIQEFDRNLAHLKQQGEDTYISALEDVVAALRGMYEEDKAYNNMPKLGLVKYAHALLTHYQARQDAGKTIRYSLEVLRGLGFQVDSENGHMTKFSNANAVFAPSERPTEIVQAFVGLADGLEAAGRRGTDFEWLARQAFMITTGGDNDDFFAMYRTP